MPFTTNLLQTINRVLIIFLFSGLYLIAGFSLIALSPISLEDYSAYRQSQNNLAEEQTNQQEGDVAGVVDNSLYSNFQIDNLLQERQVKYNFKQIGEEFELSANFSFDQQLEEDRQIDLLKLSNNSGGDKSFQLILDYQGEDTTIAKLYAGGELEELSNYEQKYKLTVPAFQSVELVLIRDVASTYNTYELRKAFSFTLTAEELEQELLIEDSSGELVEVLP